MKPRVKVEDIYPITTIAYPNGDTITGILDEHLKQYTPPVKLESLMHQLAGQTRAEAGAYPSDVERWLNGEGNND